MKSAKRQKVTILILSCFFIILITFFSFQQKKPEKPNIIFILTDDHRWDALGAMGNKIIQTPHLDRLAGDGIMFRNAYVTTAICSVSRASLLSGQYQSRHQIDDFTTSFSPQALKKTYPMLLKEAGYKIGFVGKYGVGNPNDQPNEQYDFWACSNKSQPDYEMTDEEGNFIHHTDKVAKDINQFLTQFAGKDKSPFCLSVSFKAPHEQDGDPPRFIVQERFKQLYTKETMPVPQTADPKYWNSFPDFFRTDDNIARKRWKPLFSTPELHQETVKNYYRLITGVDEVVGKIRNQLKQQGIDDNTIIIFTGDNGFYLGEHGLEGKWYGHEESIRVPLLIYDPRNSKTLKGKTPEQIALNVDIAPTILTMASVRVPEGMQGKDLIQLVNGKNKSTDRKDFFYKHTFMGSPGIPKVEGVVSREVKYMNFIEHGYEELYDLTRDPLEKENLANVPAYTQKLESMRKRYGELKKEAN